MGTTFFRAALLGICVLLSGYDPITTLTTPASTATALGSKIMDTFWWVSVTDMDEVRAEALHVKVQAQLGVDSRPFSAWKNDLALMHLNHATDTRP